MKEKLEQFQNSRVVEFWKALPHISKWYWTWYIILTLLLSIVATRFFKFIPLTLTLILLLTVLALFYAAHVLIIRHQYWSNVMSPFDTSIAIYYLLVGLMNWYELGENLALGADWSVIMTNVMSVAIAAFFGCYIAVRLAKAYRRLDERVQELTKHEHELTERERELTEILSTISNSLIDPSVYHMELCAQTPDGQTIISHWTRVDNESEEDGDTDD